MPFKVIANPHPSMGTDFTYEHEALTPLGVKIEAIFPTSDEEFVAQARDADAATAKGIIVTNVPDVFLEEVAVHAMMLLLCCAKKTIPLDRAVREGRWAEARRYMSPMPRVVGDTLGLVAFGNIPRCVARKARGFDMRILAWDPYVDAKIFEEHGVER